jgi:hypothetical protein
MKTLVAMARSPLPIPSPTRFRIGFIARRRLECRSTGKDGDCGQGQIEMGKSGRQKHTLRNAGLD